jgi:hypothetical protein
MNSCEVCSSECEDVYCPDCTYRIESNDNSDIWQRVQAFDNSQYEIDSVKIAICKHFGIDAWYPTGRKEPYVTAKHLFIYVLFTRFKYRQIDICKLFHIDHCIVNYICHKYDRKFQSEVARKKYESILNL